MRTAVCFDAVLPPRNRPDGVWQFPPPKIKGSDDEDDDDDDKPAKVAAAKLRSGAGYARPRSQASINRLVRDPYHAGGMRVKSSESAHYARRKQRQERPTSPGTVDVAQLFEPGTEYALSPSPEEARSRSTSSPTVTTTEPIAEGSSVPEGPPPAVAGPAAGEMRQAAPMLTIHRERPIVHSEGSPLEYASDAIDDAVRTPGNTREQKREHAAAEVPAAADASGVAPAAGPMRSQTVGLAAGPYQEPVK